MKILDMKKLLPIIGGTILLIIVAALVLGKPYEEEKAGWRLIETWNGTVIGELYEEEEAEWRLIGTWSGTVIGEPTEITAAESHDTIRNTGEMITRTVLGMLNENELEITDADVECIDSAVSLLDQSKAAFYAENYAIAAELAENLRQLIGQLKQSLNITEANLEDIYVAPPADEVSNYKGVWTHNIETMRDMLMNVENLKRIGVNFITVNLDVEMDEDGNMRVVDGNAALFYALAYHRCGFRVLLMPDPCHPTFADGFEWELGDNNATVRRGPEILEKLTPLVMEWAEVAENYGVEMYSPVNETQTFVRSSEEASQWAQQILPELLEKYSGKLVLRTHGGTDFNSFDLDASGYDYLASSGGAAWLPLDLWKLHIREQIDNLVAAVNRDGCENGILLDFGTAYLGESWCEPSIVQSFDENIQAQALQILFEEGWEKVKGFFPPAGWGWNFMRHPAENVVEEWYGENGTLPVKPVDKIWNNPDLLKLIEKTLSPEKRPFYYWTYSNVVHVDNENPGPNGYTTREECDGYALHNEEYCDEWLRERGIEGYGSNFFVEEYIG